MRIGIEALRRARSVYAAIWCGQGTRSEEDIENRIAEEIQVSINEIERLGNVLWRKHHATREEMHGVME